MIRPFQRLLTTMASSSVPVSATAAAAKSFKALHVPGKPLLLANVYDATSARIVASLPQCVALATASFALAKVRGTEDAALTLEEQLPVLAEIARVAAQAGKPLTVDLQDGYGDGLEAAVEAMVGLGVVGINLEDSDRRDGTVMEEGVAVERVRRAVGAAAKAGVPEFVVNARSDTYLKGGTLDEAIRRGRLYLDAGATSIYILGGGPKRDDVKKMVDALGGMVNLGLRLPKPGVESLTTADLTELGVARVSVGPQLYFAAVEALKSAAATVFGENT